MNKRLSSQASPIRKLARKDATAFATLRLAATQANPECFCTSVSELQLAQVEWFANEIEHRHQQPNNLVLGYFRNQKLIGAIGIEQLHGQMRRHKARIWGLMVLPSVRRQGVARTLCLAAIEQAKEFSVEKVSLELTSEALAAMQLYRSLNFKIETIEPMALKHNGHYMDEIKMALCFQ